MAWFYKKLYPILWAILVMELLVVVVGVTGLVLSATAPPPHPKAPSCGLGEVVSYETDIAQRRQVLICQGPDGPIWF